MVFINKSLKLSVILTDISTSESISDIIFNLKIELLFFLCLMTSRALKRTFLVIYIQG